MHQNEYCFERYRDLTIYEKDVFDRERKNFAFISSAGKNENVIVVVTGESHNALFVTF